MKNLYRGLLTAIGIIGLNSLSWGQCFNNSTNFHVSRRPEQVVVGDFNGDGRLDLATANIVTNNVSVLLNTGSGNFGSATDFPVGIAPYSIVVGDFNGDNKLDLATANNGDQYISLLIGSGTGNFSAATKITVLDYPHYMTAGDFNGDGKLDLATSTQINSQTISVLLNNGYGSFSAAIKTTLKQYPLTVTSGDFNGDGKLDLITTNNFSNKPDGSDKSFSVFLGNGDGSFSNSVDGMLVGFISRVAIADLNTDGKLDVIAISSTNAFVLLGNGDGSFRNGITINQADSPAVSDFNKDGKTDLAMVNGANQVSVRLGTGDGSFSAASTFNVGLFPHSIAVGDFDGDSKQDLVTANYEVANPYDPTDNATVSVLLNCTSPPITNLVLTALTYDCTTGLLTLSTTGGNSQPIEYRIAGLRDYSASPTFTVPAYQRNGTSFTLEARQSGQVVSASFLTACQSTTTTPPTSPTQPTGTGLTLTTPAYDCNAGQLTLSTTGGNGQPIDFRIAGLRDYATSPTFLVPAYQRMGTSFTLEARQSGQVVTLPFTSACQSTTTTPPTSPTQPTGSTLSVSAQPLNCQTGALLLSTTGGDGTPIEYKVPGLRDYGSSALFTVPAYQRTNTTFTLYARQNGREVTGTYAATCPVSGRLASTEPSGEFRVVVYPNPVGEQFSVGVSGASGQVVRFHLTNLSGQTVVEQRAQVSSDAHSETLRLPASGAGLYLLQVSTPSQSRTVKVLKP